MKKLLNRIVNFVIFFIFFSILLNSVYIIVIMTTDWDFRKRIETLKFDNPDFDILILGSSLAQYGIDTELMTSNGIKSYNMALVGNSIKTCYIQLNEYINRYATKPRFVILAANSYLEEFNQEGIHPVVEFTMKNQEIDFKDIPLSKFRWQGTELFKKAFSGEYRKGYVSLGQLRRYKTVRDDSDYKRLDLDFEKYKSAKWLGKMAQLCNKEQIELIIIEMPGVNETRNSNNTGPFQIVFSNNFSSIIYNMNSVEFCKYIDPQTDWVGLSHLNNIGAAKFTMEIIKVIPFSSSYKEEINAGFIQN
jgi:hypothetical protein